MVVPLTIVAAERFRAMPKHSEKAATDALAAWMQRCQNFLPTPFPGHELMPLKLRPTGLAYGIEMDRPDYFLSNIF